MWGQSRDPEGTEFSGKKISESEDVVYVDEPAERDIGPAASKNVLLNDLFHMANDYSKISLNVELAKVKKIEGIFDLTENPDVETAMREVNAIKKHIKEKKAMLDQLALTTSDLRLTSDQLALTDRGTVDVFEGVNNVNIDQKLKEMEKRIMTAMKNIETEIGDADLYDTMHKYHGLFKQSLESIENIAKCRPVQSVPATSTTKLRQFLEDARKAQSPGGEGDADVCRILRELKNINRRDGFTPNKIPFIPDLPYNVEDELAQLSLTYDEDSEEFETESEFLELGELGSAGLTLEPAPQAARSSILEKIEAANQRKERNG